MDDRPHFATPGATRIAFFSIVGFWLFYLAIGSVRAAIVFHDVDGMLAERVALAACGMMMSAVMGLVLRRIPVQRWRRSIAVAALLALPASGAFAAADGFLFVQRHLLRHGAARAHDQTGADGAADADARAVRGVSIDVGRSHGPGGAVREVADQTFNAFFFFSAWATLYLALRYSAAIGALERNAARLRSAAQAAELRALRYQVNPHFLFNTLNSLSGQVLSGRRDDAERMIANLATFFRTSLTDDPTRDVRLSDELRLQALYLDIEKVRFPQRLQVEFDAPEELADACVPGLILQPLIENAVKHGVARTARPVTVQIVARVSNGGLMLRVEDDGQQTMAASEGTGIGLANVADRLMTRFGSQASCRWGPISDHGFAVELNIPLVRHAC